MPVSRMVPCSGLDLGQQRGGYPHHPRTLGPRNHSTQRYLTSLAESKRQAVEGLSEQLFTPNEEDHDGETINS